MTARVLKNLLVKFCQDGYGNAEVVTLKYEHHMPFNLLIVVQADNPALGENVILLTDGDEMEVSEETEEAPPG